MIEECLAQLGLSDAECTVYLELLKLGPQPASVIARRSGLNRTTAYSVLEQLLNKGLVGCFDGKSHKSFVASDPNSLLELLDRRCRTMEYYRNQLSLIIPKIRERSASRLEVGPKISYFDGLDGVKNVFCSLFSSKSPLLAFLDFESLSGVGDLLSFLSSLIDERINCESSLLQLICFESPFNRSCLPGLTDLRFSSRKDLFLRQMFIVQDKIAYFCFDEGLCHAILISGVEVASMQRCIFDQIYSSIE